MKLSPTAASTAANAVCRLFDGRTLSLMDAKGTVLAELRFATPAFAPAVNGEAKAHPLSEESSAKAAGKASRFQVAGVCDGTVGTANADIEMDNVDIMVDGIVSVTAVTYRQPR